MATDFFRVGNRYIPRERIHDITDYGDHVELGLIGDNAVTARGLDALQIQQELKGPPLQPVAGGMDPMEAMHEPEPPHEVEHHE